MFKRAFLTLLATAALATAACSPAIPAPPAGAGAASDDPKAGWPALLTLGLFGGDDAEAVIEGNKPVADRIQKVTGIPVKLFTGTSYTAVIEAMRAKRVDGMQVGPFSYLLAVQEAGAEALGIAVTTRATAAVYDASIRPSYFSVISVKKGRNKITSLQDLKGHSLNYVDPASTSGHLVPKTELIKAGIDPDKDLKTVFAGSHPTSAIALWNGKSDAAASTEATLYNLAQNKQIEFCGFPDGEVGKDRSKAELKVLYDACPDGKIAMLFMSPPIPNTPFAVRSDLPATLKAKIREALLTTKDDPEFIATAKRWYLDPSKEAGLPNLDQYYNPLRDIAKTLNLDLKTLE